MAQLNVSFPADGILVTVDTIVTPEMVSKLQASLVGKTAKELQDWLSFDMIHRDKQADDLRRYKNRETLEKDLFILQALWCFTVTRIKQIKGALNLMAEHNLSTFPEITHDTADDIADEVELDHTANDTMDDAEFWPAESESFWSSVGEMPEEWGSQS
ncbi:hypothetical protein C8R44DRAFT_876746 [Mycena epipterygia]|nr:hypothetical protein C8R44DRAFT_876746 [Mycena epipterygia]